MTKHTLTKSDLARFYGTEVRYRHGLLKHILYTEGVQYVAEHGGAYWLIDEIAFAQTVPEIKAAPFQVWTLNVYENGYATLTADDGNGDKIFAKQIPEMDFPLDEIRFYFTDNVILLISEY